MFRQPPTRIAGLVGRLRDRGVQPIAIELKELPRFAAQIGKFFFKRDHDWRVLANSSGCAGFGLIRRPKRLDFVDKLIDIIEAAMNRCVAQIRDLIESRATFSTPFARSRPR